jgi:citronellol/citronellal dehydrogenase
MSLAGKTLFMSGGSRGIGLAIAKAVALEGGNVVIAAKTAEPHPKLPGTVYTAAEEINAAGGGRAVGLLCDVRSEAQVEAAIARTIEEFGGIDICVNNASAISLTDTANTPMKRYDLMNDVNVRGTYMLSQKALPFLQESKHAHILNLSPPLDMRAKWFKNHVAYTIAKYGMSMCVLGMAEEFKEHNVAVNALWPITAIDTAAVRNVIGDDAMAKQCRSPAIMADAAVAIFNRDSAQCTGNFFIDEEVLIEEGVNDLSIYQHADATELLGDFFVPDEVFSRSNTKIVHSF